MDFIDQLKALAGKVPALCDMLQTEEATKNALVMPFIRALGYDIFDPFTDAYKSYMGLSEEYIHEFTSHAEEYVRGNVHTNGIENFWSLLKRSIKGTYVSVEPFHLFRYLDEQAFRFNERKGKDADRFVKTVKAVSGKRLTYEQLTGEVSE